MATRKKSSIEHRRRVREVEAKRDRLLISQQKGREDLAKIRAELKALRKSVAR